MTALPRGRRDRSIDRSSGNRRPSRPRRRGPAGCESVLRTEKSPGRPADADVLRTDLPASVRELIHAISGLLAVDRGNALAELNARRELLREWVRVLLDETVSIPVFVTSSSVASVLRSRRRISRRQLAELRTTLHKAASFGWRADTELVEVIARLENDAKVHSVHERDIATMLGVHPANAGRFLRRRTGLSFREWAWATQIRAAVPQLISTPDLIKAISEDSGFGADASGCTQFCRAFRAIFGVSPSAFREIIRSVEVD